MSGAVVVCVPNFSEGRRPEVIGAILDALRAPGVRLLHHQADPEHNRLDTTIAGSPEAVRAAVLAAARVAVARIDMDEHRGGHPRMGAVDVVPFFPLRGIDMDGCVALARGFAEELASALDLPVYCYDRAATSPERASLAEVRRGEYEGLRDAVARGERLPDAGPHVIGRAGATAVGARKPLVAFNLYLTGDESAAKELAREVRESSGGLPAVRAIGFAVPERGCVTVSMNLVDHDVTPPRVAFEEVRRRAEARGMRVLSSEIVGLVPRAALGPSDVEDLLLEGFDPATQVLEEAVARAEAGATTSAPLASRTLRDLVDALASADPTPGGGAGAAAVAAIGAGLLRMLVSLSIGRDGSADLDARLRGIGDTADAAQARFLSLADLDGEAFDAVMAAFRLPRGDDAQREARTAAIQRAYAGAAEVPLETARLAADLIPSAAAAIADGNANAASDGLSAAEFLAAAARAALANVRINAASIRDAARAAALRDEADRIDAALARDLGAARDAYATRVA